MRVLVVHCGYKYKGGEDTVVAEEIALLKSNGVEVDLLSFNNEGNNMLKLIQLPFNIRSYHKTKKKIGASRPDVVHIHNLHFAASNSIIYAAKKLQVPIVMTLHNFRLLCPSGLLFYNGKLFLNSLKASFPWKAVTEGVYQNSKLITFWLALSNRLHQAIGTYKLVNKYIVLSEHAKNLVENSSTHFVEKLVVKPNFCYRPNKTKTDRSNSFLFLGRLSEEKGIRLLLDTFMSSNHNVTIAGTGPLQREVEEASAKFKNITYVGNVDKTTAHTLLQQCTALVFPSIWYEGMPLTIIEAFSNSTPVIAAKIGAMQTMISHEYNGLHFAPNDLQSLSAQLNSWVGLSEREIQQYQTNALYSYESNYSPELNIIKLIEIYNAANAIKVA